MSAHARQQLILEVWAEIGNESAGAAELDLIQQRLLEQFGTQGLESPASIGRTLADQGVRLRHPEILEADVRWREQHVLPLFTSDELNFTTIDAAGVWIEKLCALPQSKDLRSSILQMKNELASVAASRQVPAREREVAAEVAQWLTVWLQNPAVFADWLILRREVLATKGTRST